jgi:AcrR family transcriptional regulator
MLGMQGALLLSTSVPERRSARLQRGLDLGSRTPRIVKLAGSELRDHRHICALVDGPGERDPALMAFVLEGLAEGDRAFVIVDPNERMAYLAALRTNGVEVDATMASRQLEVRTWTESYLRGGRFDRTTQLAFIRQALADGRDRGFPLTRLVATMEWSIDADVDGELLTYEARINELLRKRQDVVICAYDLNRHSARMIADVLGVHAVALVGGVLRTNPAPTRASARDRLVAAAADLFAANGIQATGVDAIIEAADVAKATFYRHFPSKDDLVVAWLRDPAARWLDGVRARVEAQGATGADAIPVLFETVADWLETGDYRGCPYLNTAAELMEPNHPARVVIRDFLQEVEDYLTEMLTQGGYEHPRMLASELQALLAGSITLAVARRSNASALSARDAAITLLATASRTKAA